MILVFVNENDHLANELRTVLGADAPLVFQSNYDNLRALLSRADTVIIHHTTTSWGSLAFPEHDNVIVVVPDAAKATYPFNLIRNLKQARVRDTFLLSDEEDRERLKARLNTLVIQEKKEMKTDGDKD